MPTTNDKTNAKQADNTTADMAAVLAAVQAELAELRQQFAAENASKASKAVQQFGQTGKQQVQALAAELAELANIDNIDIITAVVENTVCNARPVAKTLTLQVRLLGSLLAANAAQTQASLVKRTYELLSIVTDVAPATVSAQLGRLASPHMYSNYAHKPFARLANGCLSLPVPRNADNADNADNASKAG